MSCLQALKQEAEANCDIAPKNKALPKPRAKKPVAAKKVAKVAGLPSCLCISSAVLSVICFFAFASEFGSMQCTRPAEV